MYSKELKDMNMEVISLDEFKQRNFDKIRIATQIDIQFPEGTQISNIENLVITKKTKRNSIMYAHDFKLSDSFVLSFSISTMVGPSFIDVFYANGVTNPNSPIAETFPDFCWVLSEGTNEMNVHESCTKIRSACKLGDLTWVLPSKFCDDLIEMMHSLNLTVLEGTMQDSILYGPYFY